MLDSTDRFLLRIVHFLFSSRIMFLKYRHIYQTYLLNFQGPILHILLSICLIYFIDFYEIFISIKAILAKHVCFQCSDWSSAWEKPVGTAVRKFPTIWLFLTISQTFAKTTVLETVFFFCNVAGLVSIFAKLHSVRLKLY